MSKYIKISEVAKKYSISSRTLRYYEEIGLLSSIRDENTEYRKYDSSNINRLEQILLLRSMEFSLNDISKLLLSKDNLIINNIFLERLTNIKIQIEELVSFENILNSCIKISSDLGVESVNFYNLLREQIYINTKNERFFKMNKDVIVVKFGLGIIPIVDPNQKGTVLDEVKAMRRILEGKVNREIPLIRFMDDEALNEFQLVIHIKDRVVYTTELEMLSEELRGAEILKQLQRIIEDNIDEVTKVEVM